MLTADGSTTADAMALAIGAANEAEFDRTGLLEADLLRQLGLRGDGALLDVGCGSGRLAAQMDGWFTGRYLGVDISAELVAWAKHHYGGRHRSYAVVPDLTLPADGATFDVVCFFSVLTHLRHEESYLYLAEARRVLRPGGRIVASFLEFGERDHWAVFGEMIARRSSDTVTHVNQFISLDALHAWAELASIELDHVFHGMTPHIVRSDADELGTLGQSVVVFTKPAG